MIHSPPRLPLPFPPQRGLRRPPLPGITALAIWSGQALGQDQNAQGMEGTVRLSGATGFQSDSGRERCCGADHRLAGRFGIHHLSFPSIHGQMGSHGRRHKRVAAFCTSMHTASCDRCSRNEKARKPAAGVDLRAN
jgi:hypothetical protein